MCSKKILAILIDGDNASAKDIKLILDEMAKYGKIAVKRVYGNFISTNCQWKEAINEYAIKPMQQFAFTVGKNANDGFMIIDAMDLLYTNRFNGFCIVSSDSDFTSLAIRLREQGMTVYGVGKKQIPAAFSNACNHFFYVEDLHRKEQSESSKSNQDTEIPLEKLHKAFENSNWIELGLFGKTWKTIEKDFTPKKYGYKKLSDLIKDKTDFFQYKIVGNQRFEIKLKNNLRS